MKNRILYLFVIVAFMAANAQATVWRVNNTSGVSAHFTNFADAQMGAASGDTLHLEGSATSYGDLQLMKPLVIIGTGYFLSENPQTQASPLPSTVGYVYFQSGSSNSMLMGLTITGQVSFDVGSISLIGNRINAPVYFNNYNSGLANILIFRNYMTFENCSAILLDYSNYYPVSDCFIINNFIASSCYYGVTDAIRFYSSSNLILSNNIITGNINVVNSVLSNNILRDGVVTVNNNTYYNNLCNAEQFPDENDNQLNIDMGTVFVGSAGNSTDGQWQLISGSPASGAGNDGTDCGMFGSASPYILSGMPPIPSVYEIIMPATGNNVDGINVTVKAKSH
jgi:hypothetical protein